MSENNSLKILKELDDRYIVRDRIDAGKAGSVYRVSQVSLSLDRAMKILDPKKQEIPHEEFERTFSKEIKLLTELTHRNVVKIMDAGKILYDGKNQPCYVMDLVHTPEGADGPLNLASFFDLEASNILILDVIEQLLNGIAYLHSKQVLHCDLKPQNILLEQHSENDLEVRITDLGVSKVLGPVTNGSEETYLYGSPSYAPGYAQEYINNQKKRIPREKLREEYFPHFDLFSLGATLAECLSTDKIPLRDRDFKKLVDKPKTNISAAFNRSEYAILKRIVMRLTTEEKDKNYPDIEAVRQDIRKLQDEYLWPLDVREMAVGGSPHILTQPLERVYASKRAYRIIRHPVFQRLHFLNQLNFVYLIYSGAHHSRFTHSLSAFEMAKRYIEGLVGDPLFKYLMGRSDYELFLLSALIHDIGHYPLAHALEDLYNSPESDIKQDYDSRMVNWFLKYKPHTGGKDEVASLEEIIKEDWGFNTEQIVRIVAKKGTPESEVEHLIKSMIDGSIDIDKVSYLIYDSYFTGASYGLGIDLNALLSSLVVIPEITAAGVTHTQLGITDKGIAPADSIIAARYSMFTRVYWHHVNRGIMVTLQYAAFEIFSGDYRVWKFEDYLNETVNLCDLEAAHLLEKKMDEVVKKAHREGKEIRNPITGLLDGSRRLYRRIIAFSNIQDSSIHEKLTGTSREKLEALRFELTDKIGRILKKTIIDGDVLLDVPLKDKRKDILKDLFVDIPFGTPQYRKLEDISGQSRAIYSNFQDLVRKCRIFINPDIWEPIEGSDTDRQIRELICKIMKDLD